jgi:hypothetical protein
MKDQKKDEGRPFSRGMLLPAAATGVGMFAGGMMGAAGARAILRSPGMRQKLSRMSPAQRKAFREKALLVTNTTGNMAGAGAGYLSHALFQDEMDKRKKSREKSASAFLCCLEYLNGHE